MTDQPLVAVEGVWYAYPEGDWVLRDVDLHISPGEYLAIIGPNGAGKSTLARHLNGLLQPTRGLVRVLGISSSDLSARELASAVGYVFQNPDHQIFAPTIAEEVSFGPRNLGLDEAEIRERTDEALSRFGLRDMAERPPALLGFAIRRKVALAAVYAMRPRAFILDEPTGGMDGDSLREVMDAVGRMYEEGHTIVLITHDMRLVAEHAARAVQLHQGRLVADASPRELFGRRSGCNFAAIEPPQITRLSWRLAPLGMPEDVLTVSDFELAYHQARSEDAAGSEGQA